MEELKISRAEAATSLESWTKTFTYCLLTDRYRSWLVEHDNLHVNHLQEIYIKIQQTPDNAVAVIWRDIKELIDTHLVCTLLEIQPAVFVSICNYYLFNQFFNSEFINHRGEKLGLIKIIGLTAGNEFMYSDTEQVLSTILPYNDDTRQLIETARNQLITWS